MPTKKRGDVGAVYRCSWEKIAKGYRIRTLGRRVFVGEGRSFEVARNALLDDIMEATGDGEAYLDIESPPPMAGAATRAFFKKAAYKVWGEAHAAVESVSDLYEGGICPSGLHPAGPRNGRRAVLQSVQRGAAGALATRLGPIFSEKFVRALPESVPRSIFRPMKAPAGREPFFELDVSESTEPPVLALSLGSPGSECKTCGFRIVCYSGDVGALFFVGEKSLSRPFAILGCKGRDGRLVLRADVWSQVARRKLSRICSSEVPVAPSRLIVPRPRLPKIS